MNISCTSQANREFDPFRFPNLDEKTVDSSTVPEDGEQLSLF